MNLYRSVAASNVLIMFCVVIARLRYAKNVVGSEVLYRIRQRRKRVWKMPMDFKLNSAVKLQTLYYTFTVKDFYKNYITLGRTLQNASTQTLLSILKRTDTLPTNIPYSLTTLSCTPPVYFPQ